MPGTFGARTHPTFPASGVTYHAGTPPRRSPRLASFVLALSLLLSIFGMLRVTDTRWPGVTAQAVNAGGELPTGGRRPSPSPLE